MKALIREFKLILHSLSDLVRLFLPDFSNKKTYKYAFLVHPRNIKDVYRKYPLFKHLPISTLEAFLRFYWPVKLSKVTGLKSIKDNRSIEGFILTIPLTAHQMMEDRHLAKKRIIQALKLAKKSGAKIIGLGGLTSSLTRGGLDLIEASTGINITTGHAYTAFNVTKNLFTLVDIFGIEKHKLLIAIVGAAGSIGSTSAKIIAREKFSNLILIDLERKKDQFTKLISDLKIINPDINISVSHRITDISNADFIIAATNAPEALIKSEDVKAGAVVIDDAQPSDVSPEVLKRPDVLVIEAGVVHTPDILSHFNFNLKERNDNFCCMAEVLILAALGHDSNYVINRATLEDVDYISKYGEDMGFRIAKFQNFNESIDQSRIVNVKNIALKNHVN